MTENLAAQVLRLTDQNRLLWRAYELMSGNPYQHLTSEVPHGLIRGALDTEGYDRWSRELAEVREALREEFARRRATGVSLWCDFDRAQAEHDARRRTPRSPRRP